MPIIFMCQKIFSLLYMNSFWNELMKLTLSIFYADTHLYEECGSVCVFLCVSVCVCICLHQNLISIPSGLLKAVTIVMTNERKGFHRFLSQNMWHSHLFLCPSVCSLYTITAYLHGNSQWALANTSLHSLHMFFCVCPHALSGIIKHLRTIRAQSVGFVSQATSFSFHILRIVLITVVLEIVPIWVVHLFQTMFYECNVCKYLEVEILGLHNWTSLNFVLFILES